MIRSIRNAAIRSWYWLKFGTIREEVQGYCEGEPSEFGYFGRGNVMIGFKANGSFAINLPYQGQLSDLK